MKNVCVCGAGTMGRGIAMSIAAAGIPVILYDLDGTMLTAAETQIQKEIEAGVFKNRMTAEDGRKMQNLIRYHHSLEACRAPLIIEAIVENISAKTNLCTDLASINHPDTLFATNTSSLSVTGIASATSFPEKIIGLHFFNPADRMKLVEIIRTRFVTEETIARIRSFAIQLGKTAVVCHDTPGFIVNRVARPFYLEALRIVESNVSDITRTDQLMESAGFKMGPFHLMDLIGNDINYTVSRSLYEALDKPVRLRPSVLQEEKVKMNILGKKTGRGFFDYHKTAAE